MDTLASLIIASADVENPIYKIADQVGVNGPKLLAQVILFLIVALVLKKFAFAPVQNILEERQKKIELSLADAEKIKKNLKEAEIEKNRILTEASTKADQIIEEARTSAEKVAEKKIQDAVSQAEGIIKKAHEATVLEKDKMLKDLKSHVGKLVVMTTEKVVGKTLTSDDQSRLSQEATAQIGA